MRRRRARAASVVLALLSATACGLTPDRPPDPDPDPAPRSSRPPVFAAAPEILAIRIDEGSYVPGKQEPYRAEPGDELISEPTGATRIDPDESATALVRGGDRIGYLVEDGKTLFRFGRVDDRLADTTWMTKPESFTVTTGDRELAIKGVHHLARPGRLARTDGWDFEAVREHTIYLRLDEALKVGERYQVVLPDKTIEYTHQPATVRSESVQVNQIGFRPDDPSKRAFLSLWLGQSGSRGAYTFADGTTFRVVNADSGKAVYTGIAVLSQDADTPDNSAPNRNSSGTDVYLLDFSELTAPGTYRVVVEGVGSSYDFAIARSAWAKAATISLRGFAHQRSGIALGPPWTSFERPADFTEATPVYASTATLMDTGNGLCAAEPDGRCENNFDGLVDGVTTEKVGGAVGGYHDAGDWDRRIQHLYATRLLIESQELLGDRTGFDHSDIPESGNGIPDILDEARYGLEIYRTMQTPEGGIRGGVESSEHPKYGEGSWQESLTVMAYAPDVWSSYIYAGVAARFSVAMRDVDEGTADLYAASAERAMKWAEREWLRLETDRSLPPLRMEVTDERVMAALEMYRLTGDNEFHDIYLAATRIRSPEQPLAQWTTVEENSGWDETDASFLYLRLDSATYPAIDEGRQRLLRQLYLTDARETMRMMDGNGYRVAKANEYVGNGWGSHGAPQAVTLVRAHLLTDEERYLKATLDASLYGAGANPMNLTMTTGVGANPVKNPHYADLSALGGVAPPSGITVYGPLDLAESRAAGDDVHEIFDGIAEPAWHVWPTTAAFFDSAWDYWMSEFTIMQTIGPNAYVWNYLAHRR
ncbi:MAG: glycoside hydrolase family 9 protein [Nocardioides sp.]